MLVCHVSTTIAQQRKNDGVSWVESQTGAQDTETGPGASLHVAEVTLCTSNNRMLPFVDFRGFGAFENAVTTAST